MTTNFPHGLEVYGVPVFGGSFVTQGNVWFVNPDTGSDANAGNSVDNPFATLGAALAAATANQNDVVYLLSSSNTVADTTDYQTTTLNWNKDLVHLIGICSPTAVSQRARIAAASGSVLSPVLTVSASGCIISNVQIYNGEANASALLAVTVTGQRNYFDNVHFAGIGSATQSAPGAASLKVDAGAENVFNNCTIGLDTSSYDADATGVLFDTAATRNKFQGCIIQGYISAAGYAHVTVADGTGIDRWQIFDNCIFIAESTNKAVTQTSVFSIPSISQGKIILQNSMAFSDGGAVDWDSNNRGIIWNNQVAAAASAAGGIMTNQ